MKLRAHAVPASFVALALLGAPDARKADCDNLIQRYDATVGKVLDALRRYEKCVSASDRRDDCAAEIEALDNAHDDFADEIDDIKACK